MFRRGVLSALVAALVLAVPVMRARPGIVWPKVDVAAAKTSIYVGVVTMTMPTFAREGSGYVTSYTAKVFPYFFYNETGRLTVRVSEEQLAELARGKAIDFTGDAVRTDGAQRHVTGRATPYDATHGNLDVHVAVSKHIDLIFHTTYRFHD